MPEYGDDAFYVWSVTIAGLLLPILMIAYSVIKVRLSKARLDRLKQEED
ncbi:MAG: hypothetical protein AAGL90_04035 [Pseudomonadota bacterium]